jgi:hypothetical protein
MYSAVNRILHISTRMNCNRISQVKVKVKYATTGGQSVSLSWCQALHMGPKTRSFLLSDSFLFVDVRSPFLRENGSAVYNCFWPSPAQSFSGSIPAGFMTKFYSLRFETPPTWRARSPVFISPRNRVAQLYPQPLGSFFVASYDSQGYDGGTRIRLHAGVGNRIIECLL